MDIKKVFVILVLCLSMLNGVQAYAQELAPISLSLTVFLDGTVDVEYVVEIDADYASVNLTLFGDEYSNVLVNDADGLILDWEPVEGGIEVDSIGADMLTVSYSTPSLTNKTGSLWSVFVTSPVNAIYILPRDAVLVGLTPAPLGIAIVENRAEVTMPNGTSKVSYLLGTTGTRERALVLLDRAEEALSEIELGGIIISEAEDLLQQARAAFDDAQYSLSESLSNSAVETVEEIEAKAADAEDAIDEADALIQRLSSELGSQALSEAQSELDSANNAFLEGEYDSALLFAEQAFETARNVEVSPKRAPTVYLVVFAVLIIAVGGFIYWRRASSKAVSLPVPEKRVKIDLDRVFRERPHLRTEDKAVLRFVDESGGAFITDVRNRFGIPKSSAWRMTKRLEKEGLIAVSMVDGETYITLREQGE